MTRALTYSLAAAIVVAACARGGEYTDSAAGVAGASTSAANATMAATATAMTDADIFGALALTNAAEVAMAEMALDSSKTPAVRTFATMMVRDHQAMAAEAGALARQLGVVTTAGDRTEDAADDGDDAIDDLRGRSGADFDRAFTDAMIESHEKALELIDRAAEATGTARLDEALAKSRVKVQAHLEQAKTLKEKVKG
jgi:putative membrane protein